MATDIKLSVDLEAGDVTSAAEELKERVQKLFENTAGNETSAKLDELLLKVKSLYEPFDELYNKAEAMKGATFVPDGLVEVSNEITDINKSFQSLKQSAFSMRQIIEEFKQTHGTFVENTVAYKKEQTIMAELSNQYANTSKAVEFYKTQLQSLERQEESLRTKAEKTGSEQDILRWNKVADQIKLVKNNIEQSEEQLGKLNTQAVVVAENLQKLKDAKPGLIFEAKDAHTLRSYEQTYERVKAAMFANRDAMKEARAEAVKLRQEIKKAEDTDEYKEIIQNLDEVVNKLTVATKKTEEFNDTGSKSGSEFGLGPKRSIVDLFNNIKSLSSEIENFFDGLAKTLPPHIQVIYSVLKLGVKQVVGEYKEAFNEISNIIKNGFTKTVNVAASAIKALVKEIAKLASNVFLSPIKKLGDAISNIGKQANTSVPSLKQIGRAFLQYGLGARSLYRLINKLRTALFAGFADLALVDEPFNAAMSSIISSLEYLKNAFAAAFAPIVQAVAPALSSFINMVAEAVTWVGQLIALLTGQPFKIAVPTFKDYASSTSAGAAAAKNAAKAEKDRANALKKTAKEMRTIAGFDDVEILKAPDDNDSTSSSPSSGGGGGGGGTGLAFQTAPISEGLQKFADMLKEIWEKADAYDLGVLFGKKLGDLLRAFNEAVPDIEAVTTKIAKIIASFLAGFLSVNETFAELGKAIGNVVNIVFTTLDAFLDTFISYDGFKNLGKDIYLTILNALNTIEWETIYKVFGKVGVGIAQTLNESITKPDLWEAVFRTLTGAISALLARAYGFVHTLKWGDIGTAFADGVIEGIRTFPYVLLATTAAEFVNGIFNALGSFADEMEGHWEEIGKNIANTIRLFFAKTDSKANGKSLGKFLQGLFDALKSFAETIKFEEISRNIIDFIDEFFKEFDWKENADTLLGLLNDLLESFLGMVDEIGWENIIGQIWDYIKNSPEVDRFLGNIWDTIRLIAAAKLQLKLMKFYLLGKMIIGGILNGIVNALLSIGTWIENHIFKPIYDAIMSVFDMGSPSKKMEPIGGWILEGILQGIINAILNIGAWINEHIFTPIKDGIFSAFGIKENSAENIKETGTSIIQGIWDGITEKLSSPVEWLQEHVADPVKGGLEKVFGIAGGVAEKIKDVGSAVMGGFQSGADDETPKVTSSAEQLNTDVQTALSSGDWNNIGSTAITKVKSGMDGVKATITNTAQTIQQGVYTALEHADWSKIGSTAINAMKSGMDSIKTSITTTAKNIQSGVYKTLETADWSKIGSTAITKMKEGMDSIKSAITTVAQTIQKGVYTALETGDWSAIGSNALTKVKEGIDNLKESVVSTAESVQSGIYDALDGGDWYDIGDNIIDGIWDGLNSGWDWLKTKVWNLAVSLFNAACNALGIHSPSKLFAEKVGEMIPAGIGLGITDNEKAATSSVETMAQSLVDSAKNIKLPPIAMGEIIPSNVANNSDSSQNTLSSLLNVLQSLQSDMVTRSELEEMLTDMFRTHMNIDFHIGDEKLARHVNRGNSLLDRRYNPVKS